MMNDESMTIAECRMKKDEFRSVSGVRHSWFDIDSSFADSSLVIVNWFR